MDHHEKTLDPSPEKKHLDPEAQLDSETTAKPAISSADPPPNGGLRAWLHVLGAFMLWFNTMGIWNAFGVFQTYYESGQLFTRSSSDISWIGSIRSFMLFFIGVFVRPFYDRGYLRMLLVIGSFGVVFGHMMLSLCTEYWQVLLAQGFCEGIGAGCLFVPSMSVLPTYFSTKIGLAIGLGSSGASIGGIIYPVVLSRLIDRIGFAWSVRVMGFIILGTLLIPILFMRMRVRPPKPRAFIEGSAFTDVLFMIFTVATFIGFMGFSINLTYISYVAAERQMIDSKMTFYIVAIFNVGSFFGRIAPNALSDQIGPFNIIAPCAITSGVLTLCMMAVESEAAIIVLALLIGFFGGVFTAMPPVCFVALIKDKHMIGTRIGMGFGMIAFSLLVGAPGAGAIMGTHDPLNWRGLWSFAGVSACVAGVMYAGLRVARGGFKFMVKA